MIFRAGRFEFRCGDRTLVMGIINVTPDSFSDGGLFFQLDDALEHAKLLAERGADIIDVGGESTRPGAEPVSLDEECERVVPLIGRVAGVLDLPISVDTAKSEVARLALEQGASIVNDVSGLKSEPEIAHLTAQFNAGLILMHRRGDARTMQSLTRYGDLISEIKRELYSSVERALKAGVPFENIVIDPGIGFSKTLEQNLFILKNLSDFKEFGRPILIGTSRKSVIGSILGRPVDERVFGTAATVALSVAQGADIVRVHDVVEMRDVVRMSDAICHA